MKTPDLVGILVLIIASIVVFANIELEDFKNGWAVVLFFIYFLTRTVVQEIRYES